MDGLRSETWEQFVDFRRCYDRDKQLLSAYAQITAVTTRVTILAYTMPIWAVLLAWTATLRGSGTVRCVD
jgi:hypothetical protein